MKGKRLISAALSAMIIGASFGEITAFAAEGTILCDENFENQTVGSVPEGVYSEMVKFTDTDKTPIVKEFALVQNEETEGIGNYIEFYPMETDGGVSEIKSEKAKMFFTKPVSKKDGILVIEYDGNFEIKAGDGTDGRKHVYVSLVKSDRSIYKSSEILNHKGSDVQNVHGFLESKYSIDTTENLRGTLYWADDPKTAITKESGKWSHYKMEINLETGEQQIWINGRASEIWRDKNLYTEVAKGSHSIDAISFNNFLKGTNDTVWKVDNIKAYTPAPDIKNMTVKSYDGKLLDYEISSGVNNITDAVTTMVSDITLEFGNKMNTSSVAAALHDNTVNADEPVIITWDSANRLAALQPERKYLTAGHSYTLSVSGQDVAGNSFSEPMEINFVVGNDGGLAILSNEILSGDAEVNPAELKTGDTVTAKITYVLTDETMAKHDVILALVGEKNDKLCGFKQAVVDFDEPGCSSKTVELTVGETVPDMLSAFVWSLDLRQAVLDKVSISAE